MNKTKLLLLIGLLVVTGACVGNQSSVSNAPSTNVNVNQSASANTNTAPQATPDLSRVAVTLPIIDALLSDEEFKNKAKAELQISDEEIQKLTDSARDSVLKLSEDETEDAARSTTAATRAAQETVREVLGAEKGDRFLNFVRQQVAGDTTALASAKPNAVPTDTRIVVNSPAYRMDVFENGQLKKSYKVGIGYPEFPLPIGLRRAKTIIFNPTWTPPDEPWVKGKVAPGKTVEAGSKLNPLGPIKIPIGLPSLIHGGKNPSRLGTFASHGCVGLTNDQIKDFALELSSLAGNNITTAEIEQYGKDKTETKNVDLQQEVPVELRYETIVVEDGKLKIYRDVYERGTNNEENLRRVFEAYGVSFDSLDPADKEKVLAGLEQMASDAKGKPVDASDAANSNSAEKNTSKTVTRDVKGKKELVFEVAQLSGKGYPAPVGMKM